ncbi:MAG: M81 family metallopeptidase [Cyclobacteriaceae bacterium]|nr:M81 family metallopeptidase [Cyclobacteriaceae bacterium]
MKKFTLYFFFLSSILLIQSCTSNTEPVSEKFRVAVIKYQHETCTFCPGGDTKIEDWTEVSAEEVLKSGSFIKGFVHSANNFDNVELIGINSPNSVFGGSSRSWNTKESFEHFMNIIIEDLKSKMPVQGVYLALHGAMAVRDVPRPEAEIAKRVREVVGDNVPIAGSFDLHGNEDEEFLKWSNAAFVTKRYPHYDAFIQGGRSANFIYRSMKGNYVATTATRKPPVLTATVLQWTGQSPSMDIMERARRWEARQKDTYVSVFYGFPWSDVPDIGATVHVITNNDQQLADSIANDMADFIWRVREDFAGGSYLMPDEAVSKTKEAVASNQTPVVLGDYSDRPGDATWILKELIDNQVEDILYATLTDARALEKLKQDNAKPGDTFDMEVGGYTGPQAGKPVHIKGKIKFFGPKWSYENIAAIEFGKNNLLIITPTYEQIRLPERLRFDSINPDNYQVFVVKSRVHFRRGFDETGYAKTILVVDAPGPWFGTTRLDALDYKFGPISKLYPFEKTN